MQHNLITLGQHTPVLGHRVYIDPMASVIGQVKLGDDCSVWPFSVIRGDMHSITIGANCSIQDGSVLHITHASRFNPQGYALTLGNNCTIGHKVCLHGCTLGNNILVGIGSIILDGARIDDNVIIGANSLVTPHKHLESGFLYTGSPAKKARPLNEDELKMLPYMAKNYVKLKHQYLEKQD